MHTPAKKFEITQGTYIYVGSCGASCTKRILRHVERPKTLRWHVDYLQCKAAYAAVVPVPEKKAAKTLAAQCPHVPHFGSTDDPTAPSHLFKCDLEQALYLLGLTT